MDELYMVLGMATVTYLIRYIMFPISGYVRFPDLLERSLEFVPPAVLSAIIFPSVLMPGQGALDLSLENPYLVGAVGASLAGWFFKNILTTIVTGMVLFFFYKWLVIPAIA
ncbi:MAG: AzlD domain-containing protein [Desulfobacteraceae bacterium]